MRSEWDVVLVEDDPDLSSVIAGIIRERGLKVWVTADVDAAARAVRLLRPSVLLADLSLSGPGGDARALVARLRSVGDPGCPRLVLMSGSTELKRHAGRLGAVATLSKPFGVDDLVGVLQPLCGTLTQDRSVA